MKNKFLTSIIMSAFVLVSCGSPQPANSYIVPQQINEPTIAEITPVYETQVERVNNCDGTNPTYNVSYKTIEAQKASFEVSVGAGGLVTGTPIPPVLEVQLEAKITAALAKDYGLTTEKNHDLTLDNVQGTFLEHTITWKVTRVKGLIEVIYGDGIAQVGFEKIANVELYDRTSKSLGCNGQSATIPPPTTTVATKVPVATLQTEPPPLPPADCSQMVEGIHHPPTLGIEWKFEAINENRIIHIWSNHWSNNLPEYKFFLPAGQSVSFMSGGGSFWTEKVGCNGVAQVIYDRDSFKEISLDEYQRYITQKTIP